MGNVRIDLGDYEIRSLRFEDAGAIVEYGNSRSVSINLRDSFPFPYTLSDALEWVERARIVEPESHFAIANSTELIGAVGLERQRDIFRLSAEIGYWIGEPFWGRGIATAAVKAVCGHAFKELNLVRLYAYVFEWNPASARVLEKAGFECEGRLRKSVVKDGKIIDQFLYARLNPQF